MYHVTKMENAESIWDTGLSDKTVQISWAKTRRDMRQRIDSVGMNEYSDWANRTDSVFLWPTYKKARRYAERYMEPAIVEIIQPNKTVWSLPNHMLEDLFQHLLTNNTVSEEQIKRIVNHSRKWNGEYDNSLELWVQSPISADNIQQITDYTGEPIQFS